MKQVGGRGRVQPYLIAERVTSDDDRLDPSGNRFRYPLDDDRFTEDGPVEDVSDLPVPNPQCQMIHKRMTVVSQWINVWGGDRRGLTDSTVRAPPHLLQLELFHSGLVRGDSSALDTDIVLLDGLGRIDGDLVVGLKRLRSRLRRVVERSLV
jgi:hypothetical protein